jgi:hypothetical protein
VSPAHIQIATLAIRSVAQFFESNKIYIITAEQNFRHFSPLISDGLPISLIDEDRLIPDVSLKTLQEYFLKETDSADRAGWYFQQFLKMEACKLPGLSDYYLIWDSDTIALSSLKFIHTDGKVYVNLKHECHTPYFETMERLLGVKKCTTGSFISEHLMVKKSSMSQLIKEIQQTKEDHTNWCDRVLQAICPSDLAGSGFSEYETYGSFVHQHHPDHFIFINRKSTRNGTRKFGPIPSSKDLLQLMSYEYSYATFEIWKTTKFSKLRYNKAKSQLANTLTTIGSLFSKRLKQRLNAARAIAPAK